VQSAYWPGTALLRVQGDRSVRIDAERPLALVVPEAMNLALALLLARRGYQILHGGAVARRGACAVVLGPPGAGKSSLVLEASRRGLDLISDEIVPFRRAGGKFLCPGSNPMIRVDPILLAGDEGRREGSGGREKVVVDVRRFGGGCAGRPSRMALLVFLGERLGRREPAYRVDPLTPSEALLGLLAHTYNRRVLGQEDRRRHLRTCAAAVRVLPAYRLQVREGLDAVAEAARELENLLERAGGATDLRSRAGTSGRTPHSPRSGVSHPAPPRHGPPRDPSRA